MVGWGGVRKFSHFFVCVLKMVQKLFDSKETDERFLKFLKIVTLNKTTQSINH